MFQCLSVFFCPFNESKRGPMLSKTQNIFLCVPHEKQSHTGLIRHEDENFCFQVKKNRLYRGPSNIVSDSGLRVKNVGTACFVSVSATNFVQ